MKAVMISASPQQCENILSGSQTILVKKTFPKLQTPFKCYIYCTKTKGRVKHSEYNENSNGDRMFSQKKIIGEFICNEIEDSVCDMAGYYEFVGNSCSSTEELWQYGQGVPLYGWHVSDLKIYDKPKELSEFLTSSHCFNSDKMEWHESIFDGHYFQKYWENDFCRHCKYFNDFGTCDKGFDELKRPPASWCYVEEA